MISAFVPADCAVGERIPFERDQAPGLAMHMLKKILSHMKKGHVRITVKRHVCVRFFDRAS